MYESEQLEIPEETLPKRSHKPSIKVIENRISTSQQTLDKIWKMCLSEMKEIKDCPSSLIADKIVNMKELFKQYLNEVSSLLEFCTGNTEKSTVDEIDSLRELCDEREQQVNNFIREVSQKKSYDSVSISGSSSKYSDCSSVTSLRLKVIAKVAAAKKKAEMQKKRLTLENESLFQLEQEEAALNKRKREERMKIELMKLQEEEAMAIASAKAVEDEFTKMNLAPELDEIQRISESEPQSHVRHFLDSMEPDPPNISENKEDVLDYPDGLRKKLSTETRKYKESHLEIPIFSDAPPDNIESKEQGMLDHSDRLSKKLSTYSTKDKESKLDIPIFSVKNCEFIARREILPKTIKKYDDKPENFHTWEIGFRNLIKDIPLSATEQLALLEEYTSRESLKLVQRMRNSYITNPEEGLRHVWEKLKERFGSDNIVSQGLLDRLQSFNKINFREVKRLEEFGDTLLEILCAKNDGYLPGLRILDEPAYIKPLTLKLPDDLQRKWQDHAFKYKTTHQVQYPPFKEFASFVQQIAKQRNDPLLAIHKNDEKLFEKTKFERKPMLSAKTSVMKNEKRPSNWCILHDKPHPLRKCRQFLSLSVKEKLGILKRFSICYKCIDSLDHVAKNCRESIYCEICRKCDHQTAMHPDRVENREGRRSESYGEEQNNQQITNHCTEVCSEDKGFGKSCAKICLAEIYNISEPFRRIKAYVVIDDQSNGSLAKTELFDQLNVKTVNTKFVLKTCSGRREMEGRRGQGLMIESIDKSFKCELPVLTECNSIPSDRDEIPLPAVAKAHTHLKRISDKIPELNEEAEILLLLGRDVPQVHKVLESINGPTRAPWAQRLNLGWVVLGNVCLGSAHEPREMTTYKTYVMPNGRPSFLEPCPNALGVKVEVKPQETLGEEIFIRTPLDENLGLSIEDRKFIAIMNAEMRKDKYGNWEAPLPFKNNISHLPNTRGMAMRRLLSTRRQLDKKPKMKEQYFQFMGRLFECGHAEIAEENYEGDCWYLPHFGVYHPKKNKIRVVFDSAAECEGVSLNKLLLSGPDLTNNLLGVLLRFRLNPVAIVADIEQMFYSFKVREDHTNMLRFLWYENNDPHGKIREYKMRVHIFGNTCSPAIANYGLKKTAEIGKEEYGEDAKNFVCTGFYVDDGLHSAASCESAVDLIKRTKSMLKSANIRLHKFASNKLEVMDKLPSEDCAFDMKEFEFEMNEGLTQRSLGVLWNLQNDSFVFKASGEEKPFSKRGVLSTINSLYDPLGMAAPIIIKGKGLMRDMTNETKDWDKILSEKYRNSWMEWCDSLMKLNDIELNRSFGSIPTEIFMRKEMHVFSDASEKAVAAAVYLRLCRENAEPEVSFVLGKAKLTPTHATSIPRLELCAAVLAVEIAEVVKSELQIKFDDIKFYTDSRVVLGYIKNETRRFHIYVANRIERIHKVTNPSQWQHVRTDINPADVATRPIKAENLSQSKWLLGPTFLKENEVFDSKVCEEIISDDPEVRKEFRVMVTEVKNSIGSDRFCRFSTWQSLQRAIGCLIRKTHQHQGMELDTLRSLAKAKLVIIKAVQRDNYFSELCCLEEHKPIQPSSALLKLKPVLDSDGIIRVGGRLQNSDLSNEECHPIIVPGKSHIALLLVRHIHEIVKHQGKTFTSGKIRSSGFWITGASRLVAKVISKCVTCKKIRGKPVEQQMADLPRERLNPSPPFSYVGLDVFGPWEVHARRTRGGQSNSKRWAVLFTCMTVRAVHIEIIENMDASSFINALRRFIGLRGSVRRFRSDCGTNFTGAVTQLGGVLESSEISAVQKYLLDQGSEWIFNPPHASHFGGVWERMIGVARRILDSILKTETIGNLTHEVLSTLMVEVSAIINNRPLVEVSADPDQPEVLTPATLLTQKSQSSNYTLVEFCKKDMYVSQWKKVQHLADNFWSRWRKEYLYTLQSRKKWKNVTRNVHVGDIVLLHDDSLHRNNWPMARVVDVQPDSEGNVRKVTVLVKSGEKTAYFRRPIKELVLLLEVED